MGGAGVSRNISWVPHVILSAAKSLSSSEAKESATQTLTGRGSFGSCIASG